MNKAIAHDSSRQHHVLGEDAPRWLTLAFGVVGACVAAAAAWLWLTQGSRPQVGEGGPAVEQGVSATARPEASPVPVTPAPLPATTPPAALGAEQRLAAQGTPSAAAAPVAGAPDRAMPEAERKPGLPPTQAPAEAPAKPEDCLPVMTVPFKFDSATLSPAEITASSTALLESLEKHPEAKLYVQGYADSAGWDQYNLLLSYRRAKSVVALLNKAGIPAQRIIIRAAGSHEPIEGMPRDAGANRRVTLQVTGIAGCS
jgi:outer membrane protein OmpA-like peptidoglycan-associated protein